MRVISVAIGIALTLSVVSFVLVLWPIVGDAPWEEGPTPVEQGRSNPSGRASQAKVCLQMLEDIGSSGWESVVACVSNTLARHWKAGGCDEYLESLAK